MFIIVCEAILVLLALSDNISCLKYTVILIRFINNLKNAKFLTLYVCAGILLMLGNATILLTLTCGPNSVPKVNFVEF